jgi:hypothetical protein
MGFVDISSLGTRTIQVQRVQPVEVDPVTHMVQIKNVMVTETVLQPHLNLEEAKLLEGVTWVPYESTPGMWKTIVTAGEKKRRFLIDTPTYEALHAAPVAPVVEAPKPKKASK